jgi:cytochrome P450
VIALDDGLRRLFASEPAAMADAFSVWRELRDRGRPYVTEVAAFVPRYEDAKRVLRDTEHFGYYSFGQQSPAAVERITASYTKEQKAAYVEVGEFELNYMNRSGDGDTHARLRRIAHRAFTPRQVEELTAAVERNTNDLLDEIAGHDVADLAPFAFGLPLMLICDMLGVPAADRARVHDWSSRLGRNRGGVEPGPLVDARDALREFRAYVSAMLEHHREDPASESPLVHALVGAEHEERLSEMELTAMFVILLFAGHETTTNLIGTGLLELLRAREQWRLLCDDPSLAADATEELLRFVTPVQWLGRGVLEDVELSGVLLEQGQYVIPALAAANRDAGVFAKPDVLDLRRGNAREHLSLGFGIHFCLGASLARLEGRAAFETLARRFPDLELAAAPEELGWRGHAMLRRLEALPVHPGRDRSRPFH